MYNFEIKMSFHYTYTHVYVHCLEKWILRKKWATFYQKYKVSIVVSTQLWLILRKYMYERGANVIVGL